MANKRYQRDAPEVVGHDRQCGQLGRQGEEQEGGNGPGHLFGFLRIGKPGDQPDRPILEGPGVQDQAERGGEGELETDIPEHQRVEHGHDGGGNGERVQPVLAAAELAGEDGQRAHDGGPHHRGRGAHQHGVEQNGEHRQDGAAAPAQQAAEQQDEQARPGW